MKIKKSNNKFNFPFSRLTLERFLSSVFLFFTASTAGYVWEVLLTLILTGTLCNRGFLYGPWLPIYGFGALFLSFLLKRFSSRPVKVFFLSALAGSLLELITGLALHTYWHIRYWDYSSLSLDLNGYISLLSFLGFGLAGSLWICFLSPRLLRFWNRLPLRLRKILVCAFLAVFLPDYLISFLRPNAGPGITFQP